MEVPVSLLLDPDLTATAKLLWLLGPGAGTVSTLAAHSGLAVSTVRQGLARLAAAGWSTGDTKAMAVPGALLRDRRLGASPNTLKLAVSELSSAGWLEAAREKRLAPVRFRLLNPDRVRQETEVAIVRQRIEEAKYRWEQLMREYLSLLVDSEDFEDDAAPGFMVNPFTDERLQFDRYYPVQKVAWEFNGAQHDGPTKRYPSVRKAAFRQGRDLVKLGLCVQKGVTLVVVHPEDLSLKSMQQKIGRLLPLRDLTGHELLIEYLVKESPHKK